MWAAIFTILAFVFIGLIARKTLKGLRERKVSRLRGEIDALFKDKRYAEIPSLLSKLEKMGESTMVKLKLTSELQKELEGFGLNVYPNPVVGSIGALFGVIEPDVIFCNVRLVNS